jgi:23S rRNA (cytidine1920-2'-O)/16S rRNA (cytidine1409-2'-O)-methyltransferase
MKKGQPIKKKPKRIDELLVDQGHASTLKEAQALILAGKVLVKEQRVDKASQLVADEAGIRVKSVCPFVSRGGEKLAAAIEELNLYSVVKNAIVLDVGASTGGFTDCCLQRGALKVYALDIGTNQLAWRLRCDERVICMEQTDIKDIEAGRFSDVTLMVADISFNSISVLLPEMVRVVVRHKVHFLVLVKPQFELPREKVPRGGVVTDPNLREEAAASVAEAFKAAGLPQGVFVDSRVKGRSGNQEIFYYVKPEEG